MGHTGGFSRDQLGTWVYRSDDRRYRGQIRMANMREFRRKFRDAGESLQKMKEIHAKAAEIAAHGAEVHVPVGDGRSGKPGRLKNSIRYSGTQRAAIIRAGSKRIPYAPAIHWGRWMWPNVDTTSEKRGQFEAFIYPRLFLSYGAKETESNWLKYYMKFLDEQLDLMTGN